VSTTGSSPRGLQDHKSDRVPRWLNQRSSSFLSSVEVLWEIDFHHESSLPDLTIGQVITHVARCADDYADILHEFRTGGIPPVDEPRRWPEDPGGHRPGAVVIDDITTALSRLHDETAALACTDRGRAPGIDRVLWDALVEIIVHDLDMRVAEELDAETAAGVLVEVVTKLAEVPGWPRTRLCSDGSLEVFHAIGEVAKVQGSPRDLLAWLTGRPLAGAVTAADGAGVPALPAWRCHREFEKAGG
jgi:uncharacterized protein (TIGR03083 family)